MQQKMNPAIIAVAVVALLVFCFLMYRRAASDSPTQLAPSSTPFKPGYSGGGSGTRPAPGSNR